MADLWPYGLPADQLGDLGQAIAQRYGQVATRIETRIRKLAARGVEGDAVTQLQQRLLMARELEEYVQKVIAQVPADQLAQMVTSQAAAGASATISRILADVPGLESYAGINGTNISSAGLQAVAAIELDLRNAYTNLNQRILRDSQDIYQSITAEYASLVTAGVATRRELKREILAKYLEAGVGSYIDGRGRHWPIDVYAEMSTRTAASRAWREQSVSSMESHGVEVFSPVAGRSSCSICGPWAGKIVSRVHPGGTRLTIRNAQTGEMVQITVDASLEEMRNLGWGHPNCRCILIPATPGLGVDPENFTTRDPVAEADRAEERKLRRELQKTDDPALKRELRKDLREVRTRIDQRKTNYATRNRPKGTNWKPIMTESESLKWASDSVYTQKFYHGTNADTASRIQNSGFSLDTAGTNTGTEGLYGRGIYLAPDKSVAELYSDPFNPGLVEARVNVKNPMVVNHNVQTPGFAEYRNRWIQDHPEVPFERAVPQALQDYAKSLGYDSIIRVDDSQMLELVLFDKKQVVTIKT